MEKTHALALMYEAIASAMKRYEGKLTGETNASPVMLESKTLDDMMERLIREEHAELRKIRDSLGLKHEEVISHLQERMRDKTYADDGEPPIEWQLAEFYAVGEEIDV